MFTCIKGDNKVYDSLPSPKMLKIIFTTIIKRNNITERFVFSTYLYVIEVIKLLVIY